MRRCSSLLPLSVWSLFLFGSSAGMVAKRVTIPAPIVVEPSLTFDGNDGPFSSFNISVGTPPQIQKVFPASSVWQTLVVFQELCAQAKPPNCAARGGGFSSGKSTSWQDNTAVLGANVYALKVDPKLGYNGQAQLGFDDVALAGSTGTVLRNQTVGMFGANDTYLGLLALNPSLSNFTRQAPISSYLQNLRTQSLIPSLSWGYTAGNQYGFREKVFGSLTLGGYDRSRIVQHDGSWPIDSVNEYALNVQLESIFVGSGGNRQGLLGNPITVSLDSALPYIWLPPAGYLLFENAFGLVWNEASKLYLVNDTVHTTLLQQNASLTFTLGGMTGGSNSSVDIVLPYAAFDLTASDSLVTNATRYYPLKRAANPTQFVLGRTFFQEAYVLTDYERGNFSVFPCKYTPNAKIDIVSVLSPQYDSDSSNPNNNSTTNPPSKHSSSSKAGPIAGGVIGGIAILAAIIAALFYFCVIKPKRKRRTKDYSTHGEKTEMHAPLPENPALAIEHVDPHLTKAELANTTHTAGMAELEGSSGAHATAAHMSSSSTMSEMPVREGSASELRAIDRFNVHEMSTPEAIAEATAMTGGFPWRTSETPTVTPGGAGGAQSLNASPLQSPGVMSRVSPLSSPGLPSPAPSQSTFAQSLQLPSPVPSPPPVLQPTPQRFVRPDLKEDQLS